MSRGINVKIATTKVIKSLENALAKLEKDYKDQAKNEKAYQKALENFLRTGAPYVGVPGGFIGYRYSK